MFELGPGGTRNKAGKSQYWLLIYCWIALLKVNWLLCLVSEGPFMDLPIKEVSDL